MFLALLWLGNPAPVHAEDWLHYGAPRSCPARDELVDRVVRWLGREPSADDGVSAQAKLHQSSTGFELRFTLRTASGVQEERLVAEDCETLVEVAALKLAVAIDPSAVVRQSTSAPPARSPLALFTRAELGLALNALPRSEPLAGLGLGLARDWFRFELGARYAFSRVRDPDRSEIGTRLDLVAGLLRACAAPTLARVSFPLCAGLEIGVLRGRGFGVMAETSNQWWQGAGVSSALRWPGRGRFAWVVGLETMVLLSRPRYQIENLGRIYRAPTMSLRGWLGLEARLW